MRAGYGSGGGQDGKRGDGERLAQNGDHGGKSFGVRWAGRRSRNASADVRGACRKPWTQGSRQSPGFRAPAPPCHRDPESQGICGRIE
jgi:hypothetical protein